MRHLSRLAPERLLAQRRKRLHERKSRPAVVVAIVGYVGADDEVPRPRWRRASTPEVPLGVHADQKFEEVVFEMKPGEAIVLYTDGITETLNSDRELFGSIRLFASFRHPFANMDELIQHVVRDVDRFADKLSQSDDMCLVAFRRDR